jgi:WS/DGAT/MGAT family acyltransferase
MAQAHGDRLTATDASFLAQEGPSSHMHVGAVMIFEGRRRATSTSSTRSARGCTSCRATARSWPFPPIETGRPVWIDDPSFNLEYHVRHTALPHPGSEEQLRNLAARIHSQQLDRAKPLWETWLVQGLEGNRFALISKTHHALVDGISGVDLATVLFDAEPIPPQLPHEGEPWRPHAEPSQRSSPRAGSRAGAAPFELAGRARRRATARRVARSARARRSRASARSPGRAEPGARRRR